MDPAETNDVFDSRSKIEKEVEEAIHGLLFALCKLKKAIRLSHHYFSHFPIISPNSLSVFK